MIDDKKIEEAARTYSKATDCNKEEALLIEENFNKGAHWAINEFLKELWHPASETPKVKQVGDSVTCFVKFKDGSIEACVYSDSWGWRSDFSNHEYIKNKSTEWLYIDDLLKGGEQ